MSTTVTVVLGAFFGLAVFVFIVAVYGLFRGSRDMQDWDAARARARGRR